MNIYDVLCKQARASWNIKSVLTQVEGDCSKLHSNTKNDKFVKDYFKNEYNIFNDKYYCKKED